jgi:hypothetical protein
MTTGIYPRSAAAALVAVLAMAAPACAQLPFSNSRQAAADQYSVPPQVQAQQQQAVAGTQSGAAASNPGTAPGRGVKEERAGSRGRNRRTHAGGTAPARAAKPIAVTAPRSLGSDDAGRLPFTGFGLGLVAFLGLLLLALGCLLAVADRARRLRRPASD